MSPRTWVIAQREFLATVTRKGYLFTLVLMPLWVAFAFSMGSLPTKLMRTNGNEPARYVGIVDQTGMLGLVPGESDTMSREQAIVAREENEDAKKVRVFIVRPYATPETAQAAFAKDEISGFLVVPPDYLRTGKLDEYRRSGGLFSRISAPPWRPWLRGRLLDGRVDPAIV